MSFLAVLGACATGLKVSQSAATSLASAGSATASVPASVAIKARIRIGSDSSYESELMGEIYGQLLEDAGYQVDRRFALGTRPEAVHMVESGGVDLVPAYLGTTLGMYDEGLITGDGQANATALQEAIKSKGVTVLGITAGENTNAFVVRQGTSETLGVTTMSQLAAIQDQLKWGLPSDCDTNLFCKGALEEYGIAYPPKERQALVACDASMATALEDKAIDVGELCSTQPAIAQFDLVVLNDDLDTQPAENLAPLVRDDYLANVDAAAFQTLLDAASAKMTTDELTKLGVLVVVDKKGIEDVAREWLTQQDLLQ